MWVNNCSSWGWMRWRTKVFGVLRSCKSCGRRWPNRLAVICRCVHVMMSARCIIEPCDLFWITEVLGFKVFSQIPLDQGQFLALSACATHLIGLRRCIEVGVFHLQYMLFSCNLAIWGCIRFYFCGQHVPSTLLTTFMLGRSIHTFHLGFEVPITCWESLDESWMSVLGYPSLAVALVLPEGGRLVVRDRYEKSLAIARESCKRASVLI